jgi:homogentisate 1,2-dioxygenase
MRGRTDLDIEVVGYDGTLDSLEQVRTQVLDAAVMDDCIFTFYADRFADLRTVGRPFAGGFYTVLTARDTPDLAAAIDGIARVPLLASRDVVCSVSLPDREDSVYFCDADADTLVFVHEGGGTLRTLLGDVPFSRHDYVFVPRGIPHRFMISAPQHWLVLELHYSAHGGGLHIPRQFRNGLGQLRMDAPYCHRDFVRPDFRGPLDEGIRETVVKRRDAFHTFRTRRSPLDVVGWDGTLWPWAFPILAFQPRVSSIHVPPTWHGTFAAKGALICSFVPRKVDFHPEAIPCPYPHSSLDVDEILFYVEGNFTSRRGVGPGSISFHPAGLPHGPHPGSYEKSIGHTETSELAVMLDCAEPLTPTQIASTVEDEGYQESFLA